MSVHRLVGSVRVGSCLVRVGSKLNEGGTCRVKTIRVWLIVGAKPGEGGSCRVKTVGVETVRIHRNIVRVG